MKKLLPAAFLMLISSFTQAQDTTGMVAHWKLNGNSHDATGKGHNGTAHNLTPAIGKSGKPGTAYYFNGSDSSYITIPYKPDLNLKTFTICATFKVSGFYSGVCQGNSIITRGKPGTDGSYQILFTDNPFDGDNCSMMDTTKDVIQEWVGSSGGVDPISGWQYSPTVQEDRWYSVAATYDDTTYNIYINDTLVKSIIIGHSPMDSTGDSLSIGINIYEAAAGFPYSFKGTIDDIRIYNRILDPNEITTYTTSTLGDTSANDGGNDTTGLAVNQIKIQPNNLHFYPNPVKNIINIYLDHPVKSAEMKIYNELEQELKNVEFNGINAHVAVGDLASGLYFVQIIDGTRTIASKFIKE